MKKVFQLEKNEGRIIKRWGKFVKLTSQFLESTDIKAFQTLFLHSVKNETALLFV